MAVSPITKLFGTQDAKIFELLTDPDGGPATYGPGIDVPGIKSVQLGGEIKSVQLRGDNQLLDSDAVLQLVTVTFNYAKLNFDALAVMLGGDSSTGGSDPNEYARFRQSGTDKFKYFKFEAQVVGVDEIAGDGHITLYKCKLSEFPNIGTAEEDYATFSTAASCVPRRADGVWYDLQVNQTATAISA